MRTIAGAGPVTAPQIPGAGAGDEPEVFDVAIVGYGPVGVAAANLLGQ